MDDRQVSIQSILLQEPNLDTALLVILLFCSANIFSSYLFAALFLCVRFVKVCIAQAPVVQHPSPIRLLAELATDTLKPFVSVTCLSLRASELYMLLNRSSHALIRRTHNTNFSASTLHVHQLISATEPLRSRYTPKQWRKYKNKVFVMQKCLDFKDRLDNGEAQEIAGSRELTSLLVSCW